MNEFNIDLEIEHIEVLIQHHLASQDVDGIRIVINTVEKRLKQLDLESKYFSEFDYSTAIVHRSKIVHQQTRLLKVVTRAAIAITFLLKNKRSRLRLLPPVTNGVK